MLHIFAATYQSWPLFYLFIPTSAFLQPPTLGFESSIMSAYEG